MNYSRTIYQIKLNLIFIIAFICFTSFISAKSQIALSSTYGENRLRIFVPPTGEKAYKIAGETFADMWEKVTGQKLVSCSIETDETDLPEGDIVLIGSDAVNPLVHNLIKTGVIDGLNIQYGGDNYRILSLDNEGRTILILAGGCGRSTI